MKKLVFLFLFSFTLIGYSQNNYCDVYYTPNKQNYEDTVQNKTKEHIIQNEIYSSYELRINRFHRNHFNWSYWHFANHYRFYWYYYPYYSYHHHWYIPRRNHFWYWYGFNYSPYNWYFGSPFIYNHHYSNIVISWNRNNDIHYGPRRGIGGTTGSQINWSETIKRYERPERNVSANENTFMRPRTRNNYRSSLIDVSRKNNLERVYRDERNIRRTDNTRSLSPRERSTTIQRENINRQPARRTPTNINRSAPPSNRRGTSSSSRSSSSTGRRN